MIVVIFTEKVQDEIDCVIGKWRQPCLVDRASMPYTDAVLHETQRVTNIFPLTAPRLTSRDSVLAGYFIPKVLLLSCTVVELICHGSTSWIVFSFGLIAFSCIYLLWVICKLHWVRTVLQT